MWIIAIMLLSFFAIGKAVYQDNNTTDIYNYTSQLRWNSTPYEQKYTASNYNMTNSQVSLNRLYNVIYKGIDAIGFIVFEVAKWGIEIGFNNPEWNYLWLTKWIIALFIISLSISLLYVLPMVLALIYLSYVGIKRIVIWLKYYIKEKRRFPRTPSKRKK